MENFGSVLMLEALTSSFPDVEFVVELPRERGWSRFPLVGAVAPIRLMKSYTFLREISVTRKLLERLNLFSLQEIDEVWDMSGYINDKHQSRQLFQLRNKLFSEFQRLGKPIIMLPHSCEFASKNERLYVDLYSKATRIFVRDRFSADLLSRNSISADDICGDFAILNERFSSCNVSSSGPLLVIPNLKGSVDSLLNAIKGQFNRRPSSAIHLCSFYSKETDLLRKLKKTLEREYSLEVSCGFAAKHFAAVIGSGSIISARYHGIACGLYLSKPTTPVGWSQKYDSLVSDWGFEVAEEPIQIPPQMVLERRQSIERKLRDYVTGGL